MADEKDKDAPALPTQQSCQRCGAAFRWEPENPEDEASNLVLQLVNGSKKCDCGYGSLNRPPPRTLQ